MAAAGSGLRHPSLQPSRLPHLVLSALPRLRLPQGMKPTLAALLFMPFPLTSSLSRFLLQYLVLDPQAIRSRRRRVLESRKKTAAEVGQAREEAEHSQLLQSAPAQRRAKEAEAAGGLVITGALYGNLRGGGQGRGGGTAPSLHGCESTAAVSGGGWGWGAAGGKEGGGVRLVLWW